MEQSDERQCEDAEFLERFASLQLSGHVAYVHPGEVLRIGAG